MNAREFRTLALSFAGATEAAHMGHADFRVAGRIFATLSPDEQQGMVKLTAEQQRSLVAACPDVFRPCNGAWGRNGCTDVHLPSAQADVVRTALQIASENILDKAASAKPSRRKNKDPAKRRRR
jgi:hypothetical protein